MIGKNLGGFSKIPVYSNEYFLSLYQLQKKEEEKRRSTFTVYLVCMNTDTGHLMYTTKCIGIVTN